MLYPEKVRILAKKNQPKPEEARYWIDLTADPYGGIWKVWNGLTWIRIFASSGSGGGIEEAPSDGNLYGRKNQVWSEIDIPDVSIYATKTELEQKADKDSIPDLSNYLTASDIAKYYQPKGDYLTEIPEGYLTITEADGRYALKGESGEDIDLSDYLTIAVAAATYATKSEVQEVQEGVETQINTKQDTLVSGTNIKTINGTSLLGSGDITVQVGEDVDLSDYLTKEEASKTYQPTGHYLTSIPPQYVTETELESKGYALKTEIPNTDSFITEQEANDAYQPKGSYLTSVPAEYVTESELSQKGYATTEQIPDISTKQDTLVSGTNIKTINNQSILGQGNIEITTGTGGITDAPADGSTYGRKNNQWVQVTIPDTSEFATKTELSNKLDTETYNADKATFALKTEIPDTSTFITTETADSKYQPKGTYLTEVPDEYVTDTELTEQLALKANANELSNYLTIASATSTYATKTDLDSKLDTSTYTTDKSTFATTTQLASKQDTLVSGTNIKTVNGQTILGEGDIQIETPEGGISDAPQNGKTYGRKDAQWSEITIPDTSALATKAEIADMATQTWVGEQGYLTEHQDISNLATKEELASKANTSDLSNYLTTANASTIYETISGAQSKYQPIGEYALKSEIPSLSSYATESYVNTQISNLVNSAPETLDTLDELAAALNDDSNFATTVANQIGTKLDTSTYNSEKANFATKSEVNAKVSGTGITGIKVVSALPGEPEQDILYIVTAA